jgi:hypothetical protein
MSDHEIYDVVVAGAGIVGCLAAARLYAGNPDLKILILEKDQQPGGRLRATNETTRRWSCGLDEVTPDLFEFIKNTFQAAPDAQDLPKFVHERHVTAGVFSGGKLSIFPIAELFGAKGARKIGGTTAQNAWEKVEEVFSLAESDESIAQGSFAKIWKHTRKNAASVVLEHLANGVGITDIWSSSVESLKERSRAIHGGTITGDWEDAIADLFGANGCLPGVHLQTTCRIVSAVKEADVWRLDTEKGDFYGRTLIVAQAPWAALDWLAKDSWPAAVLEMALKTRPTSLMVLSEIIDEYVDLPSVTFITSEKVFVSIKNNREICFKTAIDFEITVDAPEVVKAVKRLKRARKKFLQHLTGLKTRGEHLELLPVAWTQSPDSSDKRFLARMDKKSINSDSLAFCGDAYGASYVGDVNLRKSVIQACSTILGGDAREEQSE